jgi:mannose-1-phosphate guanylyltransferase/mannose-6-phosphate isomerase
MAAMRLNKGMHVLVPVILSGGVGTRLWPVSRREQPKQLSRLTGERSLLQETAIRAAAVPGAHDPLIVCGQPHYRPIVDQLTEIGQRPKAAVLEPFGRNTAPAAAAAALSVDEDDLLLLLPADHLIPDINAFVEACKIAADIAAAGKLVTFGIRPTEPHTGFGYIKQGQGLDGFVGAFAVDSFVEKPDLSTAQRYLATEIYSWNSGMFMFRAGTLLDELNAFNPTMVAQTRKALDAGTKFNGATLLDEDAFAACPSDSIDYAVMEDTKHGAMVPLDAGWNDMGSWTSLWDVGVKDKDNNVIHGAVYTEDVTSSYIRAGDRPVAVIGLDNVIVVDTGDAVLIANKDDSQKVKEIVAQLEAEGRDEILRHPES